MWIFNLIFDKKMKKAFNFEVINFVLFENYFNYNGSRIDDINL